MVRNLLAVLGTGVLSVVALHSADNNASDRLTFQTHRPWSPRLNLNAGAAMVYGIGPHLKADMVSWRDHGYHVQFMTGVAWGQYQDYLDGKFDGRRHWDEAQTDREGKPILHGGNPRVPYMSPGASYGDFLAKGVEEALENGAEAIYLEEPEFWARGGWSESFKREWQDFYHEPWQSPDSSPDAQYRASKLKYFLYRRALSRVFEFVKIYGKQHGRNIPCYVPTHSLINYAHWRIVSPESSLVDVGADGYIAQVWTGTARTPNFYNGVRAERTFETAFLEYGAMQNLVRASGRRVWYLNDPIEDNPNHSWTDYRRNWENTLTASLLQPDVSSFEIMPWPERIYNGQYPVEDTHETRSVAQQEQIPTGTGLGGFHRPAPQVKKSGIPAAYESELQTVVRALGEMNQPASKIRWLISGSTGVGVIVSDTMMFQRADPNPSDANLGSFYGLSLPLLLSGIPVEPVQLESATAKTFLSRYKLLLLTYEGQKPLKPAFNEALAIWVRQGGALLVVDNDKDTYHAVREWWNTSPNSFRTPREHLFSTLGLQASQTGLHKVGKGVVLYQNASPAALSYQSDGATQIGGIARQAAEAIGVPLKESSALVLKRGPYVVAAALTKEVKLNGAYVNLFDENLTVHDGFTLPAGGRALLKEIGQTSRPQIVAAACRTRDLTWKSNQLRFVSDGQADTDAIVRIISKKKPKKILVRGQPIPLTNLPGQAKSFAFHFENRAEAQPVEIQF